MRTFRFQYARGYLDAALAEPGDAATRHLRVRILHPHDDPGDLCPHNGVDTRGRLAVVRTGLQIHIERGAGGIFLGSP